MAWVAYERLAGGEDRLGQGSDPASGLGESTTIGVGADFEEGGARLEDPRRRNEERDLSKAAKVSSSVELNDSVSDEDRSLAGSFWARLPPVWEPEGDLLAMPCADEALVDPTGCLDAGGVSAGTEDLADRTDLVDRLDRPESPDGVAGGVAARSDPDCVDLDVRGRLVGRLLPAGLDRLLV